MGQSVTPGEDRTLLTEDKKGIRIPRISAKAVAIATSAITLCIAVILISVIGGKNTPVEAADIYIGAETGCLASLDGGVGRYSGICTTGTSSPDDTDVSTDGGEDVSADADDPAALDDGRYTVTFTFFDRESVSCSAAVPATVGELADKLGIVLAESDVLSVDPDTLINTDTVIAAEKVTFGKTSVSSAIEYETVYEDASDLPEGETRTKQNGQDGELITEYSIKYVNGVEVSREEVNSYVSRPAVDEIIENGTGKVTFETASVSSVIGYKTTYEEAPDLPQGQTRVKQNGQNGELITEYKIKYVNGVEVSRVKVNSYVSRAAVDQIIEKGTKTPDNGSSDSATGGTIVGADGKTYRYSYYIDVKATMYYTGGYCATGAPADETVIAVDPTVIPLGTKVYIRGDYADIGVRSAEDVGGGIKGNIIDICLDRNNPLAYNFGFRPMRVYILE